MIKQKYQAIYKLLFFIECLGIFFCFSCIKNNDNKTYRTQEFFGTICTVNLFSQADQNIFDKIFFELNTIEELMSTNLDTSEISKINLNAGLSPVKVSLKTFRVLATAKQISILSDGAFDPTIGPLVKLWKINNFVGMKFFTLQGDISPVPKFEQIEDCIKKVSVQKLLLNEQTQTAFLKDVDMQLDVGGIAKGYAADIIVEILKENDINKAMIDLGGNIYAYGYKNFNNNQNWKIGIKNPDKAEVQALLALDCNNTSVVTSGAYERFYEVDGKTYHHLLNPKTGYPVENDILSVSIVGPSSMLCDACSTAVFVLGVKEGINFLSKIQDVEYIIIQKNKEVLVSKGIEKKITVFGNDYVINTVDSIN